MLPLTFLLFLPITQVVVLLTGASDPVIITVDAAEIGARVDVPACVAVIAQFPLFNRFKVAPVIEQIPVEVVSNVIAPALDAVAVSAIDLLETFAVLGRVNKIVCGSRVISKDNS